MMDKKIITLYARKCKLIWTYGTCLLQILGGALRVNTIWTTFSYTLENRPL